MPSTVGYPVEEVTQKHRDQAAELFEQLTVGKDFRRSRERVWRRSERQYQGKMWGTAEDRTTDLINVNMSFSTINTILPHLTGMEPEFTVAPFSKDSTPKNARIQEAYLNRMWRHKPVGAQIGLKASVFDYLVYGDGYLKTTWSIVERSTNVDETAQVTELFVDRISPWDVWLDPNSTGLDKARWAAVRVWTTEEEARADDTLKIPAGYEFTTIDATDNDDDSGEKPYHATSDNRKWVILYEMYDLTNERMYVVPEDGDKHPWKIIEGITIPVEQIPGYRIPQSPYHMGELEQIFDLQREIDKTRSQQVAHRKRNVSKVFVREDALSPEGKSALTSSVVGEMVPITGDVPLQDLVHTMQLQPLPSESYASVSQAQSDITEITGVTEYQRGTAPDITRTATEAQMMQGSANVKIDAKLNDVEHALRNIGTYMLGVAEDVYPLTDVDEMAMFIGGADGRAINQLQAGDEAQDALNAGNIQEAEDIADSAGLFGEAIVTPSEEIFVGEYEVLVTHSSTDAVNPKMRAQKYRDIMQTLAELQPLLQASGVNVDMGRMARLWLEAEKIPGVDAILAGNPPQPDPAALLGGGQGAPAGGQPALPQGAGPEGAVPPEILAMLGAAEGGAPTEAIGPDNSGALDPTNYPLVGQH